MYRLRVYSPFNMYAYVYRIINYIIVSRIYNRFCAPVPKNVSLKWSLPLWSYNEKEDVKSPRHQSPICSARFTYYFSPLCTPATDFSRRRGIIFLIMVHRVHLHDSRKTVTKIYVGQPVGGKCDCVNKSIIVAQWSLHCNGISRCVYESIYYISSRFLTISTDP